MTIYIEAEDRHREAILAQRSMGGRKKLKFLMNTTNENVKVQSVYVGIINKAAMLMLKAASEMGFTPASRPRLVSGDGLPPRPRKGDDAYADPFEIYLANKLDRPVN